MAGKLVSAIGIKQILHGEVLGAAPTYASLETAFTTFKEVQNVHQGTYEYSEEDGTLTEYKDELTGQTYRSTFEAGSQSVNFVIGAYDYETKKEMMGGQVLETDKGWSRGNAGEQRYKCFVFLTNDDQAIIFPKANLIGRGASTDGAVGLSITVTPLKVSTEIASEYWFDATGKNLKGGA